MNTRNPQLWYVGAAVVAALILVAGWLLLVSPTKSNAEEISTQADWVVAQNVMTQGKIDQLKEQSKDLPAQEQQIAAIRSRIPATPALPTLIRALSDQAKASGVTLESLTPSTPSASNTALSTIPVEVKVNGEFSNVRLFVNSLETMQRSYFVGALDIQRSTGSGTTATDGALDATITGNVFMSTSSMRRQLQQAPQPAPAAN